MKGLFIESNLLVIRFKEFFKLLKSQQKEKIEWPKFLTAEANLHSIDINEILRDQDKIDKAILFKLKRQENTYVHFVEIDIQQRQKMHSDRYPLLKFRMAIWSIYT